MLAVVRTELLSVVVIGGARCTECGCGCSFLRIVNAEPVRVAPRLTSALDFLFVLLLHYMAVVHRFTFFVIYFSFFFFYLFQCICPFLLYTPVCAITSLFSFFLFWSPGLVYASAVWLCGEQVGDRYAVFTFRTTTVNV